MLIQGFFYTKSVSIVMPSALVCETPCLCLWAEGTGAWSSLYMGLLPHRRYICQRERERWLVELMNWKVCVCVCVEQDGFSSPGVIPTERSSGLLNDVLIDDPHTHISPRTLPGRSIWKHNSYLCGN